MVSYCIKVEQHRYSNTTHACASVPEEDMEAIEIMSYAWVMVVDQKHMMSIGTQ